MTAQQYIQNRLNELSRNDENISGSVKGKPLKEAVYAKLMSKKFRKLKATEACEAVVNRVVDNAIKNNTPIKVSLLFGGNKLWRFDEAPEIDWAELFSLLYYIQWMKTIAAVFPPGVILEYYSQDISVESMNNIPRAETDKYSAAFREMLDWFEQYLPDNVKVSYKRHFEEYDDPNDYYKELEVGKNAVLKDNNGKLPQMTDAMKAATELNVKLKPGQDKDPMWHEKVELEHQAIFRTETLGKYLSSPDRISICPTDYEDSDSIITGSTKRSYAKFWAAVGALQKDGDTFHEVVLTPKQLADANFDWEDVDIEGLEGRNFKRVRILR